MKRLEKLAIISSLGIISIDMPFQKNKGRFL